MSFQCMVVFGLFSTIYAYQGTNPGYAYVDKSECQPYGSVVVESDDCKTSLNCNIGSSSSAQILYCFRDVDQTLHGSLCVYQYLSERCNKTLHERHQKCRESTVKFFPDSKFCHLYYNCSNPTDSKICPYPQWFSESTNSCEDYKHVGCGTRVKLKSYCQYNPPIGCGGSCIDCEVNHPSCEGYSDGVHAHPVKTPSPYYMVCRDERFVREGVCDIGNQHYEYDHRLCQVWECDETIDKRYPAPLCNEYIWCYHGLKYKQTCPAGTVFDDQTGSCNHSYNTCHPCGTKSWFVCS